MHDDLVMVGNASLVPKGIFYTSIGKVDPKLANIAGAWRVAAHIQHWVGA